MKLRDLLLSFAQGSRVGKRFRHRLTGHSAGKAELGIMAGITWFSAMARRLPTAPNHGGNRPGPQVTQAEEILQELGSLGIERGEIIRHNGFLSVRIYPLRSMTQKKKTRQLRLPCRAPSSAF